MIVGKVWVSVVMKALGSPDVNSGQSVGKPGCQL